MAEKNAEPAVITTTTVTATTTTTQNSSGSYSVTFDRSFAMSPQGILAAVEAFYSLIAFIVVVADNFTDYSGSFAFFMTVTFIIFVFTVCFYIGEVTHARYKIQLPWAILDMVVYTTYILALLLSSSLIAAKGITPNHGAGATIGFMLMQLYMVSLALTILQYRATSNMNQRSAGATGADNFGHTSSDTATPGNFYGGPGGAPGPGY